MAEHIPASIRKEVADLVRQQWWVRCLLATEEDRLGLILRAATGIPTEAPPWLGPSAIIDRQGVVLSNYVDEANHMHFAAAVCHVDDLVGNLRGLVDQLQLTDIQAHALFSQVKAWVKTDARPETEQPEDRVPLEYRRLN